jgi:hypothetical protein
MTPDEARAYITWFKINQLPPDTDFVRTSSGREIMLKDINDEDAVFVAKQFTFMHDTALGRK